MEEAIGEKNEAGEVRYEGAVIIMYWRRMVKIWLSLDIYPV